MEFNMEFLNEDMKHMENHESDDEERPGLKKYRACNHCERPTAGHPRDQFGQYPGYGKGRCELAPITIDQQTNLCKELDKLTGNSSIAPNEKFKCNICGKGFAERKELEHHKKNLHVVFKKQFPDGSALNQHMRQHHQSPHVFGNTTNLKDNNTHDSRNR